MGGRKHKGRSSGGSNSGSNVMMDEYGNVYATNNQDARSNYERAAAVQSEKQGKYNAAHQRAKIAEERYQANSNDENSEKMQAAWAEENQAKKELDQAKYNTDFAFSGLQKDGKGGWEFNDDGQKAFVEEQKAKKDLSDTIDKRTAQSKQINRMEEEHAQMEKEQAELKKKYEKARDSGDEEEADAYRKLYWEKDDQKIKKEQEIEEAKKERAKTAVEVNEKTATYSAAKEKTRKTQLPPKKKSTLENFKERIETSLSKSTKPLAEYDSEALNKKKKRK